MMPSFSIYQETKSGLSRIGLFHIEGAPSGRMVSDAYHKAYPNSRAKGKLYLARRHRVPGGWTEAEPCPMDEPEWLSGLPLDDSEGPC